MKMNQTKNIHKELNQLAFPILLNYLLTTLFELFDKAIVGHYSVTSFAAIGVAASVIYAITGALGILSAVFNIMAAEQVGKGDQEAFYKLFIFYKRTAYVIGILFFVLSLIGGHFFFKQVYQLKGEVLDELLAYFYPASLTLLLNLLTFLYSAYFRNQLNTKVTLYSTAVSLSVNLYFDYTLVYGLWGMPRLGACGSAWGSLVGLLAGLLVYQLADLKLRKRDFHQKELLKVLPAQGSLVPLIKLYLPLLGQEFLEGTLLVMIISAVVSRLGMKQMAIYNLLDSLGSMVVLPVYAYATATQTKALQAFSHHQHTSKEVKAYLKSGLLLSFIVVGILATLCFFFQESLFSLFVTDLTYFNKMHFTLSLMLILQLCKVPYQISMCYLQGIGKEKQVCFCTALGTLLTSLGVVILGFFLQLDGIYLCLILEVLILSTFYIKQCLFTRR